MIIPTIINLWDMIDLIFRKSYNNVIFSSTFKLLLLSKKKNLQIAVPYWELCDDEYDIDYIELYNIEYKPFYDEDNKCFIFKDVNVFFKSIELIQLQLMKLHPTSEEHVYKHFIINSLNNKIKKRNIINNNKDLSNENDLAYLLNQLSL